MEFFMASWRSLDRFLTPLDFRDDFLLVPDWFLFFQESASLLKNHQEANKKTSKSCWDAAKKHQDMSRSVTKCQKEEEVSRIFLKISTTKNLGPSRSIKNTAEVLRSYQEVSKKSLRMIKNSSSARFLFKFVKVGQLLDGQPEFNRIINKN